MPASYEAERVVTLPAGIDLHARPAAQLVRTAVGFSAQITVAVDGREANAKSLLDVLALGATAGTPLRLAASGQDADVALDALDQCVAAFG
jgi:phosphotransferase system HPr (HPr) family protein